MNKAIIIGRLGRDPELRYTEGGVAVANFTVATNESWKDKGGEKQERTEWHRIVAWGKQAEFCSNYLTKGRQVLVEGRIQTREWEDKSGAKRSTVEIVAVSVQALGARQGEEREPGAESPRPAKSTPPEQGFSSAGGDPDDVPF